jgi:hypothetical protein
LTGSLAEPRLMLVCSDPQGMSVVLVLMKMTHILGVLQVPPSLPAVRVAMGVMAGLSSSGPKGAEPPYMKACPWSFLWMSSQYAWCCPPFILL